MNPPSPLSLTAARHLGRLVPAILAALAFVVSTVAAPAAHGATPAEVETAIKKAKEFLYSQQTKEGAWDPAKPAADHVHGSQWGGSTAMATYALLAAGESPDDPRIQKAVRWLGNANM